MRSEGRRSALAPWVFLLVGIGHVAGSAWAATSLAAFRAHGEHAQGKVVALNNRRGFWYPVVEYVRLDGTKGTVTGRVGSLPSGFDRGEIVPVIYGPGDPDAEADAVIDTVIQCWHVPLTLGGLGAAWLACAWLLAWLARERSLRDRRRGVTR